MTLITDPDNLNQNTEVVFSESGGTLTIQLIKTGNLSDDGVTLQCLYSFCKEEWKIDNTLIKYPFPFTAITEEKFELVNGWDFKDDTTKQLIRTGGWALKDASGVSEEEYSGIVTLGVIGGSDQVYYLQIDSATISPTNIVLTGVVNQAVKVYGDVTHGDFDYRTFFKLFIRTYAKTYSSASLTDIGVTTMTYQVYRLPLANSSDLKVVANDTTVDGSTPYTGMSITWYAGAQERTGLVGGSGYFHVIVDGNQGTAEQIYTYVQRQLRKATDIDAGAGNIIGKTCSALTHFIGDILYTDLYASGKGTFIDDYQAVDETRLYFTEDDGDSRNFPYAAVLTLQFGDNLIADSLAKYWIFFTSSIDPTGNDYGTSGAIIVDTNSSVATTTRARASNVATIGTASVHGLAIGDGIHVTGLGGTGYNGNWIVASVPDTTHITYACTGDPESEQADTGGTVRRAMIGNISGASSKQLTFAYDTNVQRGNVSSADAPITVVAIGISTAQFVKATGTIYRSLTNTVSLVAALERNYKNE